MNLSTTNLVLNPATAIDLQLHTTFSDGTWTPEQLLEYCVEQQFGLIAITDHDRPDTAQQVQALALQYAMPVLVAVEMSASWRNQLVDVLGFGFHFDDGALFKVAREILSRQQAMTCQAYEYFCNNAYLTNQPDQLATILALPNTRQPQALMNLVAQQNPQLDVGTRRIAILDSGCDFATTPIDQVVTAIQQSGGLAILAHPGRDDGFVCFDELLLDELRAEVSLDGIEVYYPKHSDEQIAIYRNYAQRHELLISAGSDSHNSAKPPIKYRAELCRDLLQRLGVS